MKGETIMAAAWRDVRDAQENVRLAELSLEQARRRFNEMLGGTESDPRNNPHTRGEG